MSVLPGVGSAFGAAPGRGRGVVAGRGGGPARALARIVVLLVAFGLGTAYGTLVVRTGIFPYELAHTVTSSLRRGAGRIESEVRDKPSGRWSEARGPAQVRALTPEEEAELRELMTLGYLAGSKPASGEGGVTHRDVRKAYDGYNMYTSGHGPEAFLLDMDGNVLHSWTLGFLDVWPDYDGPVQDPAGQVWRRARLLENGELLAIYDYLGLVKLDSDSRLIWSRLHGNHHDLDVLDDGTIYVLEHELRLVPRVHERQPVSEDFIAVLDPDGSPRMRLSLLQAFENSDYAPVLRAMPEWGDILHTNTLEVLDGTFADASPAFRRGNVLVSLREVDTIAVIDMEAGSVVWALVGRWDRQHQPTFLPDGRMLLFNNEAGTDARGEAISEVVEFDPLTQDVRWSYDGNAPGGLYSQASGSCQRLPNGNTLITESDNGRAIEVTPDGGIVWEFVNPMRAGQNDELIASLYEMVRLSPDTPIDWARAAK
ncbi:MAG: arylsulfotransferase family protein [Candidatus Eisenbacteria bacterium]